MKRFLVLISLILVCTVYLIAPVQKAAATSTADQYCGNTDLQSYQVIHRNGTDYRQAFTPTQNRINNIAIKVSGPPAGISGLATLRVYTSPTGSDGQLLRSDRNFTALNATVSWYFNDFGDVTLTPGTTYYISLTSSIDFLYWYSVSTNGCTPTGMAYLNGAQQGYKLDYATFGFTDTTPATPVQPSTGSQSTTATAATTSSPTSETLGVTSTSITKPTNLSAAYSDSDKGIKLNWKASTTTDIDGYKIFRSDTESGTPALIATTTKDKLEDLDTNVAAGKTYFYQSRAYKAAAQSASSNLVSAAVPIDAAPAKPVNFKVVDKTFSSLEVMWRKSTDPNISGYTLNLYKGGEKIRTAEIPATARSYSFLQLDSGTLYKIDLVAKNAKGLTSTPAVTAGFTEFPEAIENIIDATRAAAGAVVLVLLLILVVNTLKQGKKK